MPHLTKAQRFLYSRIAILLASVGWVASAFAGLKGFPFWYGGFVLCFWVAFGFINYQRHSTLWFALNHRVPFVFFYSALAGFLILVDRAALAFHLWYYPFYHGWQFAWVYGVLYPFAAMSLIELFYFTATFFGEHLEFTQKRLSAAHRIVDAFEGLLFLAMGGGIVAGALSWGVPLVAVSVSVLLWSVAYLAKLAFHIRNPRHYAWFLILSSGIAALLNELPNTVAREWTYLYSELPFWNNLAFSIPFWLWFGWLWFILFTLRFWVTIVLHPKIR